MCFLRIITTSTKKEKVKNMKNMHLCPLDLSMVGDDLYLHSYLQFHVENQQGTLKGVLSAIGIPMTSYAYARKNGFLKSKRVKEAILDYFGMTLEIDEKVYQVLQTQVWTAITESYFISAENLRNVQEKLAEMKPLVKKTPLYLLYCLAYVSSIDHFVAKEKHKKELEDEIIPFLDYVKDTMTKDMQYFYLFSLTEYYFVSDKDDLALTFIDQYESLDPFVDERLKTMGYYDLFTLYALKENYPRALWYLDKCHDLCFKYYNVKRLQALRQNQTAIHYRSQNYEEALSNALGDMLYIYRQDIQENRVFFKNMIIIIVVSLIYLKRYEEALEKIQLFFEFNVEEYYDQALLLKQFCYYKLEDKTGYSSIKDEEKSLKANGITFSDTYHTLYHLIDQFNQKDKKALKDFGSVLKPLIKDTMSPYRRIFGLLKDEYTEYLKQNERYIDVLDMK